MMTNNHVHFLRKDLESYLQSSHTKAMILICDQDILEVGHSNLSKKGFKKLQKALQRYYLEEITSGTQQYVGLKLEGQYHLLATKHLTSQNCLVGLVYPLTTPLEQVREEIKQVVQLLEDISLKPGKLVQSLQYQQETPNDKRPKKSASGWRKEISDTPVAPEDQSVNDKVSIKPLIEETSEPKYKGSYATYGVSRQKALQPSDHNQVDADRETLIDDIPWQQIGHKGLISERHQDPTVEIEPVQNTSASTPNLPKGHKDDLASILHSDFEVQADPGLIDTWEHPLTDLEEIENNQSFPKHGGTSKGEIETFRETTLPENVLDITFYFLPKDGLYLRGEIAYHLRRWMPALCLTYGWQLSNLAVRPDCLQWTLIDFPESLMTKMLKIVRLSTSEQLLQSFPHLKTNFPDSDLWSTGYRVDTNSGAPKP